MHVSYDKLFAYLYKHNISNTEIANRAGVSRNSIIKMRNGELVHMSIIMAICEAYNFQLDEVIEFIEDKK